MKGTEMKRTEMKGTEMKPECETIDHFAQRSDRKVLWITMAFAIAGGLFDIGAHLFSGTGVAMLWGLWIPLCFFTIPSIHHLCRRVKELEGRIEQMDKGAENRIDT